MTCAVLMCVHAGRREPQGRMQGGKGGGRKNKKKPKTKPHSTTGGPKAQSEQAAEKREGTSGQRRDRGWRAKKKNRNSG